MSQIEPIPATSEKHEPATERTALRDHPVGFWFIFWGEFAERCCYYGMRAILLLYMIRVLGFSDGDASRVMSYFIAACYLLPLAGGYVADNYLGKYRTIIGFSLPYIFGQLMLGIEAFQSRTFLFIALGLLAMGSGVIKPNISTLMGLTYDQKRPGRTKLRSDAFAMFYGAINIGAALSSFAMPWIRDSYGYATAFLFPAALMTIAFIVFASGKPFYGAETIQRKRLTPEERRERFVVLRRIIGLFIVVTFFWSIFDQSATTWTLFAKDHLALDVFDHAPGTWQHSLLQFARDRLGIDLFGVSVPPDLLQAINPVLIILLLPPITLLWHYLARIGYDLKPTSKMLIGFVLTTVTMAIMSTAGFLAGDADRVSVLWEVVSYVLITVSEICISVVGLELAFTAAPATMKSFVTACWLLTIFFGNIINAQITPLYGQTVLGFDLSPGRYFALFALIMIPVTAAFVMMAGRFNRSAAPPEKGAA